MNSSVNINSALKFVKEPDSKNTCWAVASEDGEVHGYVRFVTKKKRFLFYPERATAYPDNWMTRIAAFMIERTEEFRA